MIAGKVIYIKCDKCSKAGNIYFSFTSDNVCTCGNKLEYIEERIVSGPWVDQTLGYFDEGLNTYIESTSDRRRIMKERKLDCATREELLDIRNSQTREREEDRRNTIHELVEREAYRLR